MNDLRYALRTLAKSPGFTAVAVLTLALGIGANTAVFSVVEGVLLRSLPFPHAERLVDIKTVHEGYRTRVSGGGTSPLVAYEAWRAERGVLDGLAVYIGGQPALIGFGAAERVWTWSVSANFFPLLGAQPMLGRAFLPEEDRPGSAPVAVLSHDFWTSRFGGDVHVIGRTLTLDTVSYTIVGVMPAAFRYPAQTQVWQALGPALSGPRGAQLARQRSAWVVGRLRPGVTPARAQDALDLVTRAAWTAGTGDAGWLPVVTPLHEYLVGTVRTALFLMFGAVGLVVLVACANVASLLLCRAVAREHEVAVRVALGASRQRLLRQVLTESVLLALGGGALGVLLALWTLPGLLRLAGPELPGSADIGVNARVLRGAVAASILVCLLSGLAPALRPSRHAPGRPMAWISGVTPDYFRALGVPLKRGRQFAEVGESHNVIIDEAAAHAYFAGEDPLGREITFYGRRTRTIVGVVGDTRQQSLDAPPPPHIYQPLTADFGAYLKILARTGGDPGLMVKSLRQAVQEVDPTVPLDRVAPLDEWIAAALARHRFYALLLAIFAATALALAATGAYGIAAYAVTRRTQEIGIRVALGAGRGTVLSLIVTHGLALTAGGLALGTAGAVAAARLFRPFLFEVSPRDPVVLASVGLLLTATALVASYLPARRATKVDPMVALRYE